MDFSVKHPCSAALGDVGVKSLVRLSITPKAYHVGRVMARGSSATPDTVGNTILEQLEDEARKAKRGLWTWSRRDIYAAPWRETATRITSPFSRVPSRLFCALSAASSVIIST